MIFTSFWFLLFVVAFFPLFWAAGWVPGRGSQVRLAVLLVGCFVFHAHFAGPAGVVPIIALGAVTYAAGRSRHHAFLIGAMVLCVAALAFYKYTHFLTQQVLGWLDPRLGQWANAQASALLPGAPPLAVSFFTFEFVHYLYDVSKGQSPIRKVSDFLGFVFFFPSLVAGPIKRYEPFIPSMHEGCRNVRLADIQQGTVRIAVGFFKKTLVADNLTPFIDYQHASYGSLDIWERWVWLAALALRILMDFSGYSDIAIGLARLMGMRLPENFNWPYLASSVTEFWHRWHMSLSTWIRDYIYIPLGGNRYGPGRKVLNGMIAFGLCGLWHGADWRYLVWGLYHGCGLAICSNYRHWFGPAGGALAAVFQHFPAAPWALTMLFVGIGWVIFFYPLPEAWHLIRLLVMND